ncbi:MAG TPA: hypothetical protein VGD40_22185, partial [Chryseosolibacter sp.]
SMHLKETIEDIVTRELRSLCLSCAHADECIYHKTTSKAVIQCELFQLHEDGHSTSPQGLCRTCDHAPTCSLRGRKEGVWRCNEFQ